MATREHSPSDHLCQIVPVKQASLTMCRSAHRCYLLSLSELALLRSLDCLFCCVREVNDLNLDAVSRECLRHPAFALKVGRRHPPNQFTHFTLDPRPACFRPAREKAPIQPESSTVPAHDGFWLHHGENFFPPQPQAPQHYPEKPVPPAQTRPSTLGLQDRQLLTQCQDLQPQVIPRATERTQPSNEAQD